MAAGNTQQPRDDGYVPMVEVRRGDLVESIHNGAIAVVDSTGRLIAGAGNPDLVAYLRSAAKPVQILPLIGSGAVERFGISEAEIAVMVGSHGGEPSHVEAVTSVLGKIGQDASALQCGAHEPLHSPAARALAANGEVPSALHNNCSGKHAGMLALAVHCGAPVATYLAESHPVQTGIRAAIEEVAGLSPGDLRVAIDGCSAPTFAMPLRSAATLYARLVAPGEGDGSGEHGAGRHDAAARRVTAAMRAHPEMVAGTDRLETALMLQGSSGLIAKIGAEGFYALGFQQDGRRVGVAIKIADGNEKRAPDSATVACLRQLGVIPEVLADSLEARFAGISRNRRGTAIGRIVSCFRLDRHSTAP